MKAKTVKYHLTKKGARELARELDQLVNKKRRQIAERLAKAREYGDLSENAEYDAAREEQAFVEGRIAEIQEILKHAVISDRRSGKKNQVSVGSTVFVRLQGEQHQFTIVSAPEADPFKGKISQDSPFAQALMGRKVGDAVEVEAPGGLIKYEILKIS